MFVVLLKFSANKPRAGEFMAAHNDWIAKGFADGVFLMTGSLKPGLGGAILAHQTSLADLEERIAADPFVAESIVVAEIFDLAPSRTDDRLKFLLA
jgi:uncharacterized protein YciI